MVKKKQQQIDGGFIALYVLLPTLLVVLRLVSAQHFDHCDDAYRCCTVQTTVNHIRFVK